MMTSHFKAKHMTEIKQPTNNLLLLLQLRRQIGECKAQFKVANDAATRLDLIDRYNWLKELEGDWLAVIEDPRINENRN